MTSTDTDAGTDAGTDGGTDAGTDTGTDARTPVPLVTITVLAKAPVPGCVKTRLCPPYTPEQAASLAAAALADTLAAVRATVGTARPVLALDGDPNRCPTDGVDVIAQRGGDLSERIGHAMVDTHEARGGPVVIVGMDTPQVTPAALAEAVAALSEGYDAVLGPAADGGFWLLGLARPDASVVRGVPMSTATTGQDQLARLRSAGLEVRLLMTLTDVDDELSARTVAAVAPGTRFAGRLRETVPGDAA